MPDSDSSHPNDATLAAFVTGRLDDNADKNVCTHVESCVDCRRRVASLFDQRSIARPDSRARGSKALPTKGRLPWVHVSVVAGVVTLMGLVGWAAATMDTPRIEVALAGDQHWSDRLTEVESSALKTAITKRAVESPVDRAATPSSTTEKMPIAARTVPETAPTSSALDAVKPTTPAQNEGTAQNVASIGARIAEPASTSSPSPPSSADNRAAENVRSIARLNSEAFFNRKDLNGWGCPTGYWHVAEGAIVGTPRPADQSVVFLCTRKSYRDFDLKFRVNLPEGAGISGVQFRSRLTDPKHYTVVGPRCVLCGKSLDPDNPAGSIVSDQPVKSNVRPKPALVKKYVKAGENHFQIRCEGKVVLIKINGAPIIRNKCDWLPDEGIIAFRLDGARSTQAIKFTAIKFTDLTASPSLAAAPTESFSDPAIIRAEMTYAAAVEKANRNLDHLFETHLNRLREKNADGDVPTIEILDNERKLFADKGFIPWSDSMRSSTAEYLRTISNAQEKLEGAFKKAVQGAEKKNDDKRVAALQEEEQSVLAPHVVAVAEMVTADGEAQDNIRLEFRSDGLYSNLNEPQSENVQCWSLKGGHLVLERPDPNESDGVLIHQCVLSADGKSWKASGPRVSEQSWRFVTE